MATASEMRAALRAAGEDVPERGRLNDTWKARYEELTDSQDAPWDDPGSDDTDLLDPDDTEPATPLEAEKPPRTASAARKERRRKPVGERLLGPRAARGKAKHKRVSVEHLIGRAWEAAARFATPMSLPLSRCLQVQSPVAGLILEEIVAGTVVDRALQPVARAEAKAEKMLALVGPPILVLALEQTSMMEPQQAAIRQALIVPMLKESLRIWLQVAGPKVEEAARREKEYQETFGQSIDEMIALFFAQPQAMVVPEPEMAGAAA